MKDYVITISRTFGSGGKRIAKHLADKLGIRYYNKGIKSVRSDNVNIKDLLSEGVGDTIEPEASFTYDKELFEKQAKIINLLADSESCIIVGRCADYVLSGRPNVFSFFIDAPKDYRIRNIAKRMKVDEATAAVYEASSDKYRKEFYESYTGRIFGDPANYDMCFDAKQMEPEQIEEAILDYVINKLDMEE
ncbi:MAG: cytidylate kinase-like family protein [Clostridiales bacterium]|nr:cytidylate kinase-like family protein [Clostridiales bacterium]